MNSLKYEEMKHRCLEEAHYILDNNSTLRKTAKKFKVCTSTVHLDVTVRLQEVQPQLWHQVQNLLAINLADRNSRGGEATRLHWIQVHEERDNV